MNIVPCVATHDPEPTHEVLLKSDEKGRSSLNYKQNYLLVCTESRLSVTFFATFVTNIILLVVFVNTNMCLKIIHFY